MFSDTSVAENLTLGQLIERYLVEVLPQMRGVRKDGYRLRALLRRPIAQISMSRLTPAHLAEHRDIRLREVSPGTAVREMPSRLLASRTDMSCLSTRRRNLLNVLTLITPAPPCRKTQHGRAATWLRIQRERVSK